MCMSRKKDLKRFKFGIKDIGLEVDIVKITEDLPPNNVRMVEIGTLRKKIYLVANNGYEIVVVELPSNEMKVFRYGSRK